MVFGLKVEQYLGGSWVDVSSDVLYDDAVTINRGRKDEVSETSAASCTYTLKNHEDSWSPKNVLGTYWPEFGRAVPTRVSLPGPTYLRTDGSGGDAASCLDTAGISITGDIDIRFDAWLAGWRGHNAKLCGKYAVTGNNRSWKLVLNAEGTLTLYWSSAGTLATVLTATSTAYVPTPTSGRKAVRATLDVNNGSGGYTVTFYTSDTISGTWTQLGDAVVTTGGTTSIYDSTANLFLGSTPDDGISGQEMLMHIYAFKVLSGIGGTEKANPDFTIQTAGDTSFSDAAGNTWSVFSEITDRAYRHWGEISSIKNKEDKKGVDKRAIVESGSLLRRLGASTGVAKSPMTQSLSTDTTTVAYWPMEDEANSTLISSGINDGNPMNFVGTPTFAAGSTSDFPGTEPIVNIKSAYIQGSVNAYVSTDKWQVRFLVKIPNAGTTDGAILCRIYTTGTAARWDLVYNTASSGKFTLICYNSSGSVLATSGGFISGNNGYSQWISIEAEKNGTDVDYLLSALIVGANSSIGESGTVASSTVGIVSSIAINPTSADLTDLFMGQMSVQDTRLIFNDLADELRAFTGETAIDRIIRLLAQKGLTTEVYGGAYYTGIMGYQGVKTYLQLLRECESTDLGLLLESRDEFTLLYRSEETLYNQDPILMLDYSAYSLSDIDIIEDDSTVRNNVTVHRAGGGQGIAILEEGELSVLDPPDGVGSYDYDKTISTNSDSFLSSQAGWILNLGTAEDPHWILELRLERSPFANNTTLLHQVYAVDVGDKILINNVPIRRYHRPVEILVQQITEVIDQFQHRITFICSPERPWHVLEWGTDRRWSPPSYGACTLAADITSSATSFTVASTGDLWTTTDLPLDIEIEGEQITVGAISGASSPQTFSSCTRAVNGVSKSHLATAIVELWDPARWAL
ncbi:MAG TPA: hypothetical protein V6C65_14250 [Allocoleopsis sp.]